MARKPTPPERLTEAVHKYYAEHGKPVTVTQLCYLLKLSDATVRLMLQRCGGVPPGTKAVETLVSVFDQGSGWKRKATGFEPLEGVLDAKSGDLQG